MKNMFLKIRMQKFLQSTFENLIYYNTVSLRMTKYAMEDYVELHKHKLSENSSKNCLNILIL